MHRLYGTFISGPGAFGLLLVRVITGAAFILHSLQKLRSEGGPLGWMGPDAATPGILQAAAAFSEFGGGIGLILGLLTPLAALGIAGVMTVALVTVHLPAGHPFVGGPKQPSYELVVSYLASVLMLLLVGPGTLSLDALLFSRRTGARAQT
jgi:putative oxidoreductase